jgi:AcrR family transcriptional regulator
VSTYPEADVVRPRRRGRPAKISRQAIVDAAIELGVDSFSMQAVAHRLGVTPPALYSHVANRDEVVALVAETVRHRLEAVVAEADDWRGWLEEFARQVREALGGVASSLAVERHRPGAGPQVVVGERGLQLLIEAGLAPLDAAHALWLTYRVAVTAGTTQQSGIGGYVDATATLLDASAAVGQSLPATGSVHRALVEGGPHDTFDFDLAVLLDGIAARIRSARRAQQGAPS